MRIGISSFAIGSSYFAQQATKPLVCVHENYDHLRLRSDFTKRRKREEKKKEFKKFSCSSLGSLSPDFENISIFQKGTPIKRPEAGSKNTDL